MGNIELDVNGLDAALKVYLRPNYADNPGPNFIEVSRRLQQAIRAYLRTLKADNNRDKLVEEFEECVNRFQKCCEAAGSDKEFAAGAVEKYRITLALIKEAK